MSSSHRAKDTGQYKPHTGGVVQEPSVEHLDLANAAKPAAQNFRRGPLGSQTGHARDPGELPAPTVAAAPPPAE